MLNIKSICVVGLGYVGLPSAALMAQAGYDVVGVDVNADLISDLQRGHCRIGEAGVQEIVKAALGNGTLRPSGEPEPADAFFICVPTPLTPAKKADVSMVKAAAIQIAEYVKPGDMVVLESTSPLNTTRDIIAKALQDKGIDPYQDVDVCYCPERVFPGNTIQEILKNDRVVGGLTSRAAARAKAFYESFCEGEASMVTAAAAEFSKLMENTFRDVNIALANVFAHIAEEAGVEVSSVIEMANRHPRVNVHKPGPGVGGHCIPVDPWFLIDAFPETAGLLKQARLINDGQARYILDRLKAEGLKPGEKVAILGAAYRGNIDDARDTPTDLLIDALNADGFRWQTHDPHVRGAISHFGHDFHLTDRLEEAVSGASAVVIMTDHADYITLKADMLSAMDRRYIYDARAIINVKHFVEAGFVVSRLGVATERPACVTAN